MPDTSVLPPVAITWVATYLAHSTALIVAVAVLTRLFRSPAARETLWRAALLGGLGTATLQTALAPSPWSLDLTRATATPPAAPHPAATEPARPVDPRLPAPAVAEDHTAASLPVPPAAPQARSAPDLVALFEGAILLGLAASALLSVRRLGARRRLRRILARGRHRTDGPLREMLDGLLVRAGTRRRVRLLTVPGLAGPFTLGVLRPEIHVPERAETDLTQEQRRALLAHELAHVLRRDAMWLAIVRTVCTTLVLQPLNRLVARRLHETAELICDHRAAGITGLPRDLADCLARVAGWMVDGRAALPAPGMASRGSLLRRRVHGLLAGREERSFALPARLAALVLLGLAGFLAPQVTALAASAQRVDVGGEPGSIAEPGPTTTSEEAILRLGREMESLDADLATLVEALEGLNGRADVEERVARLARRLAAMRARREILNPNPKGR